MAAAAAAAAMELEEDEDGMEEGGAKEKLEAAARWRILLPAM